MMSSAATTTATSSLTPLPFDSATFISTSAGEQAWQTLPQLRAQLRFMMHAYFQHIGPTFLVYGRRAFLNQLDEYLLHNDCQLEYLLLWSTICLKHPESELFVLLASVCAMLTAVLEVLPTTRLIVWGVADDADSIVALSNTLANSAVVFFNAAFESGQSSLAKFQASATLFIASNNRYVASKHIQLTLLNCICPFAISSSISPAVGCSILDNCIRTARKLGMDKLGKSFSIDELLHDKNRQIARATWLAIVAVDWNLSPFNGCFTRYPETYTTKWSVAFDHIADSPDYSKEDEEVISQSSHDGNI